MPVRAGRSRDMSLSSLHQEDSYFSLLATEEAWAGSPSAVANATAAGPLAPLARSSSWRKLVRFMKSRTERPEEKRARRRSEERRVGQEWVRPGRSRCRTCHYKKKKKK